MGICVLSLYDRLMRLLSAQMARLKSQTVEIVQEEDDDEQAMEEN